MTVLRYGIDSSVRLEFAQRVQPAEYGVPRGIPLDDSAAAVAAALENPLDYPPLAQSTTPGDRVVLALGHGLLETPRIVAAIIHTLVVAGVGADGISVLRAADDVGQRAEDLCRLVPEPIRKRITVLTHDPADRDRLAYLAADDDGSPILINRAIHEADVVLPVGCLHDAATAGYYGLHSAVFPTFSDEPTLRRFRAPGALDCQGRVRRRLIKEIDHIAWLLGINFSVQLIPGAGDRILHVLAGQSDAVRRRGQQLYAAAWGWDAPQQASLVVAAIEGGDRQQTWENFGVALSAAAGLVEDGGAIALCCDLAETPGPAMQRLAGAHSREAALRRIRKERPADTLPAAQLIAALDRCRVYLLSRLDPSVVEDSDMIYVASPQEVARLPRQHESCIVLANAPRVAVTLQSQTVSDAQSGTNPKTS